jgi:hypothetical protein
MKKGIWNKNRILFNLKKKCFIKENELCSLSQESGYIGNNLEKLFILVQLSMLTRTSEIFTEDCLRGFAYQDKVLLKIASKVLILPNFYSSHLFGFSFCIQNFFKIKTGSTRNNIFHKFCIQM